MIALRKALQLNKFRQTFTPTTDIFFKYRKISFLILPIYVNLNKKLVYLYFEKLFIKSTCIFKITQIIVDGILSTILGKFSIVILTPIQF
jgi:hypothetical protein